MKTVTLGVVLLALASCNNPPAPSLDVVVEGDALAAWASNNRVLYIPAGPVGAASEVFSYDPGGSGTVSLGTYAGTATCLDVDATDRMLLCGIGGAYTFVKQDGSNPIQVLNVEDTAEGYTGLHVSSGGTQIALATLPPQPDLQVHLVTNGTLQQDHVDIEGDVTISDLDWSLDDSRIYYGVNRGVGGGVALIRIAPDGTSREVVWEGTSINAVDRIYLSHLGDTLVFSGRDGSNVTAVWSLDLQILGAQPVLLETEGGRWNRVAAAGGFSPDGTRFLLEVEAPSGTSIVVRRL